MGAFIKYLLLCGCVFYIPSFFELLAISTFDREIEGEEKEKKS